MMTSTTSKEYGPTGRSAFLTFLAVLGLVSVYTYSSFHSQAAGRKIPPLAVSNYVPAPSNAADSTSRPVLNSAQSPVHSLTLPYYTVKGGWESILTLNNALDAPLTISLKLHSMDGGALSLPDQNLRPLQNVSLALSKLLTDVNGGNGFREGNVELTFQNENGMALGPQLTVEDSNKGLSFDMEPAMGQKSNRLEGLWWALDEEMNASVVLSNTQDQNLTVFMSVDVQGQQYSLEPLELNSHQTVLMNMNEVDKRLHLRSSQIDIGGLSLSHNGVVGALAAQGFVISNKRHFASNLHFVDPKAQKTSFLDGTGLPLAQPANHSAFPAGSFFRPLLSLRNTTSDIQTAKLTVQYTVGSGEFKSETLSTVTLKPHGVRSIDFAAVLKSLRGSIVEDAGVRVESSGEPGSVIGELVSIDDRRGCVDVPLLSVRLNEARSGAHPFAFTENEHFQTHLKNVGNKPTKALMKLLFEDGRDYALDLIKILPGQSVLVDLEALKEANKPDIHGHTFPADVRSGQVRWNQHGDQPIIGRLIEVSSADRTAANFSCGGPCSCPAVFDYAEPIPASISGSSGQSVGPLTAREWDHYEACPGLANVEEGPFAADATFFSTNANVASIDLYGSQGTLNDGGQATFTASWNTVVHNDLQNECAEGGCETFCNPVMGDEGTSFPVTVQCSVPTGETTEFSSWGDNFGCATCGVFMQRLTPTSTSFSGRMINERDPGGGGPDTCYFDGAIINGHPATPQTHVTGGGNWQVNADNFWGPDLVGWSTDSVNYYRSQGRAPCGTFFPQTMVISCATGEISYSTTFPKLELDIQPILVISRRAEAQSSRQWP